MQASCRTDLVPLPHAVVFLEESLVMGHAVLAVDEAITESVSVEEVDWWSMCGVFKRCLLGVWRLLRSDWGDESP